MFHNMLDHNSDYWLESGGSSEACHYHIISLINSAQGDGLNSIFSSSAL
jgi:hypothetical protein